MMLLITNAVKQAGQTGFKELKTQASNVQPACSIHRRVSLEIGGCYPVNSLRQ
jgi:hypothetical protein